MNVKNESVTHRSTFFLFVRCLIILRLLNNALITFDKSEILLLLPCPYYHINNLRSALQKSVWLSYYELFARNTLLYPIPSKYLIQCILGIASTKCNPHYFFRFQRLFDLRFLLPRIYKYVSVLMDG